MSQKKKPPFYMDEKRIAHVLDILESQYPNAETELDHKNPYELLVATILSAQCTDVRVNKITPALFSAYPDVYQMAQAKQKDVEEIIYSCGFYVNKAKNLIHASRIIVEEFEGQVPADLEALQTLPGVGRKTANVVGSNAFGIPAIAVDTHVFRVSNRIGLANATDVFKTEDQLMEVIPKEKWSQAHHWLILHGRRVCTARSPKCDVCPLANDCKDRYEKTR